MQLNARELERRGRVALVLAGLVGLFPLADYLGRYTPDAAAHHCATENAAVVARLKPIVATFGRDEANLDCVELATDLCESCAATTTTTTTTTTPVPIPLASTPAARR